MDVLTKPKWSPSLVLGYSIISIIILSTLYLPEITDNRLTRLESSSIIYFRDSSPIIFRVYKGRGIIFYIS